MSAWRALVLVVGLTGCEELQGGGLNLFSIQDDVDLGAQIADEIALDGKNYPILDEAAHPDAYNTLYAMADQILATSEVQYADDFAWEFYFIDDAATLNAFATPGGYIYLYTGLVDFLDYEDEVEGVLGHEIAHSDRRHSTTQLTKVYGVETLLQVAFGEGAGGIAGQVAETLLALSFSRSDEAEADDYSVTYLCETDYAADGAAGFFEKLESAGIPEFLSTHPSSDTRVEDIHARAKELNCSTKLNPNGDMDGLKADLGLTAK